MPPKAGPKRGKGGGVTASFNQQASIVGDAAFEHGDPTLSNSFDGDSRSASAHGVGASMSKGGGMFG